MQRQLLKDSITACSAACLLLAVYVLTLCPAVYWEDAGELITAAYHLDIPHPPGFPLWCLLVKPFTWIPWGSIAWRANFSSAVFCTVAASLFYALLRMIRVRRSVAVAGMLMLGWTFSFWREALTVEVYSLTFALFIASLVLFWRWGQQPSSGRLLFIGWFVYSLGVVTHYVLLCAFPVFAGLTLIGLREKRIQGALTAVLGFLSGLLLFLYLPIRSLTNPPMDWGNPETPIRFLSHILRVQYGVGESQIAGGLTVPVELWGGWTDAFMRFTRGLWDPLKHIIMSEIGWGLAPLGGIGLFSLWKSRRRLLWISVFFFAASAGLYTILTGDTFSEAQGRVILRPVVPALVIFIIWISVGLDQCVAWVHAQPFLQSGNAVRRRAAATSILVAVLPFIFLVRNVQASNLRGYRTAEDFGRTLLSSLPENAVLLTTNDAVTFISTYLIEVERFRPDIRLIPRRFRQGDYPEQAKRKFPDLVFPSTSELNAMRKSHTLLHPWGFYDEGLNWEFSRWLIKHNTPQYRFFWDLGNRQPGEGFTLIPRGFVVEVIPTEESLPFDEEALREHQDVWHHFEKTLMSDAVLRNAPASELFAILRNNFGHVFVAGGRAQLALEEYQWAERLDKNMMEPLFNMGDLYFYAGRYEQAAAYFEKALERAPHAPVVHLNLGTAYRKMGQTEKALVSYAHAIKLDPHLKEGYNNLGALYADMGRYPDAIAFYRKSLSVEPGDGLVQYNLGLALHRADRLPEAIKHYQTAVELGYQNVHLYYGLGVAHAVEGDIEEAAHAWERTLELDPNHEEARQGLERARRKLLGFSGGDLQ